MKVTEQKHPETIDLKAFAKRLNICEEAYKLLKIIDSEFQSNPTSVQCFDLQVVQQIRDCIEAGKQLNAELPDGSKL